MIELALPPVKPNATMVIQQDPGGLLHERQKHVIDIRSKGMKVVVNGYCMSACTMYLSLIRSGQVCATDKAQFWFHHATDSRTNQPSRIGTEIYLASLPPHIQQWILERGGLSARWLKLRGAEMKRMVPSCDREEMKRKNIT
jgi:hypothetical protein